MKKTFKRILFEDLKARGMGHILHKIKSVRHEAYAGGSSLRVRTLDLYKSDRIALRSVLKEYEEGEFDSMQDLYIPYKNQPKKERTAKYAFLSNDFTEAVQSKITDKLRDERGVFDEVAVHQFLCELERSP